MCYLIDVNIECHQRSYRDLFRAIQRLRAVAAAIVTSRRREESICGSSQQWLTQFVVSLLADVIVATARSVLSDTRAVNPGGVSVISGGARLVQGLCAES